MLIIIDNIYIGVVNNCFSQICNRVMPVDSCQNLVFTQYLQNVGIDREIKFCRFIIIDKIYIAELGSITLKCNALHYNYFQNHCITITITGVLIM